MNIKKMIKQVKSYLNEAITLKPYKFTVDYGDDRPEQFIAYGLDAKDAEKDLYDEYSYLKKPDIKITNVEEVPEDHEEVTEDFMMIHQSGDGPDASGQVTFFPTAFGYEYECTEKDFNGRGPKWSTIRTIEGIRNWFRNVLFEFGAKDVTIGNHHWNINDFPKNESLNEAESIYSPRLILQAYKKEQEWLKENNYEIGETPDIQLFIIENNEMIGCSYVPRKDVYTYQPEENEYYLDMVRDSGDVLTDYNLEPAQKLVDRWNEGRKWESLNEGKKREVLSDEEYAKFLLSYMYNNPTYEELLNMLPMINDDLYLEEIKTIKRPKLKSLYKKAVELKKQTNESVTEDVDMDEPFQCCVYIRDEKDNIHNFCTCSSLAEAAKIYFELLQDLGEDEIVCISEGHDANNRCIRCSLDESLNRDIVTVVDIPLVTEKLYNKLVNALYGNKQNTNRDYEQQENVLNFLQKIEDGIAIQASFSIDLEDYGFTADEINTIKKIVREERVNESLNEEDDKFNYMLLARLKQDCGYFLGNGNGYEPHLWAGNVEDQIAKMRELYNKVPEKPEWLSLEDIDKYEKDMLAKRDSKNESVNEDGCYIITMDGEPIGPNCKTRKEAVEWAENNYSIDDERIAIEYDPEPNYDEDLDESLKGYKEVAKIIKNNKGYNVAQKDEPMLVEDKPSLKSLLTELAKYL